MPPPDELLRDYRECSHEQSSEHLLEKLLLHAESVVRSVLRRRLSGAASPQDREDLTGETLLEILRRLRQDKLSGQTPQVADFPAYVAASAHHACDGFFRSRHPQRHRLKNQLRYVLRADARFAVWADPHGAALCGRASWKGRPARSISPLPLSIARTTPVEDALETIFEAAESPLDLDELTGFLAQSWGLNEPAVAVETLEDYPGYTADPIDRLDNRRRLEHLWAGIGLLPRAQRMALLLHLRDERGGPALALLPASGVASLPQIAEALEMPASELAELWNSLPLPDSELAVRLGITRQQVINLRSAARQRLARREEKLASASGNTAGSSSSVWIDS